MASPLSLQRRAIPFQCALDIDLLGDVSASSREAIILSCDCQSEQMTALYQT